MNDHNSSLEKISISASTIFNNFNTTGKKVCITISKNTSFEQKNVDLPIKEVKLELGAKIKFTHCEKNYEFANNSNIDTVIINYLHNFVEAATEFKATKNYNQNLYGEHNLHNLELFIAQNTEHFIDSAILGDTEAKYGDITL